VTWVGVLALAVGTYAMKASGPLVLGSRPLPARAQRLVALLAVALLGALIGISTFTSGHGLALDARAAGLAAAVGAIALRAPFAVVVLAAAGTTAGLRAFA
jgi:branched chain amino acid efflux pump